LLGSEEAIANPFLNEIFLNVSQVTAGTRLKGMVNTPGCQTWLQICLLFIVSAASGGIELIFDMQPIEESGDYYEVLGVPHNANINVIKKVLFLH